MKKLLTLLAVISVSSAQAQVTIDIPDLKIGNTIIKRKVTENVLIDNVAMKFVAMTWDVIHYADSISEGKHYYGKKIENDGIRTYQITTRADNNTMVDLANGEIVKANSEGIYPEGSIGQFDYFRYIAKNVPIKLDDLKRAYGSAVTEW